MATSACQVVLGQQARPAFRELCRRSSLRTRKAVSTMGRTAAPGGADEDQPEYHVMPRTGWCNDVNGPIHLNGTYHMCAQAAVVDACGSAGCVRASAEAM